MNTQNRQTETEATHEKSILAELAELDVLEAKEFQEGVAYHAFFFHFDGKGF